jgi:hypothetical protein
MYDRIKRPDTRTHPTKTQENIESTLAMWEPSTRAVDGFAYR